MMKEVVIKIPEELYNEYMIIQLGRGNGKGFVSKLLKAIKDGVPLPENHGRIIDESKINMVYAHSEERIYNNIKAIHTTITHTDAPTIIEASGKEVEE